MIALSPLDSGRFLRGERMIVIQTTLDQKAMIALARINRKTVRRGRSSPVRTFACTVAAVELGLAALFVWTGAGGWFINVLMAAIMIACVLGEDTVNGLMGLRQILPEGREVNATFKDDHYIHRTKGSETWWNYRQIKAIGESEEYFAFVLDKNHGQIYRKDGFVWGTPEDFRAFIQKKTALKIQKVR